MASPAVIYLDEEDDLVSICDRLEWSGASRVILALPAAAELLTESVDLVRLRRFAEARRIEVGLVTRDSRLSQNARTQGIPTFRTVKAAERRRAWRHTRHQLRPATPLHEDDRREMRRRMTPAPLWQRWLWRYAGILLFFTVLAALFVGAVYALPGATLTLKPQIEPIQVSRQIVADPQLDSVNYSGASVPGRRLVVTTEWRADVETTGSIEVPDAPARGQVIFANRLPQPVTVPAGTRVTATAGQLQTFQTIAPVDVPGVIGGTAEAEIVAVAPGPQGNVPANTINRLEGSLALQLEVRNLDALTGGATRLVRAVTSADQERLRAQVWQQLQTLAVAEMELLLAENEFLARDSLRLLNLEHETYSRFVGEQADRLILEMRAELQATAVDESQAVGLVYEQLAQAVRTGYELVPETLTFRSGDVFGVDNQGRVSFEMIGQGFIAAQLNLEGPLQTAAGQPLPLALAYLNQQLPLRDYPTVQIRPPWFARLPYLPQRIRIHLDIGG